MSQKTVLIVEDSPYLAESLVDILRLRSHKGIIAKNGREGVSLAKKLKPDLILLDIRLPDIDGYEVYRRVRKDSWGKTAKIMVLTASESLEVIAKNIDLPIEYILFKPDWSAKALLDKIDEYLTA